MSDRSKAWSWSRTDTSSPSRQSAPMTTLRSAATVQWWPKTVRSPTTSRPMLSSVNP